MPQTVAIISDTHLPRGRRALPVGCVERLRAADHILHAGDVSTVAVLAELRSFGPLSAVHGNVDATDVRAELPARVELDIDGVRLAMLHDAGPSRGRLGRLHRAFPTARAVIFGHSHIPLHEVDPIDGFQIFNPGSPTDQRRQPSPTMGWAELSGGQLSFTIVDLG